MNKALSWFFAVTSFAYLRMIFLSILYTISRHYAFLTLGTLFITLSFWAIVVAVSGLAWWTIWKAKPSARSWGIAASLLEILIFFRPIVFSSRFVWWYHLCVLYVGIVGLITFSRRHEQHGRRRNPEDSADYGSGIPRL